MVERDLWGKEDLVPGHGLAPSSTWRIYEAFVRDAISAMASQVLRTAPAAPHPARPTDGQPSHAAHSAQLGLGVTHSWMALWW